MRFWRKRKCLFRRRRGTTMVELVVVVVIGVVLLFLLVPTVNQARRNANTTRCISNLQQLGWAYQSYLRDYHCMAMGDSGNPSGYWMIALGQYINGFSNPYTQRHQLPRNPTYAQQISYLPNLPPVWFCPDAPASNVCEGEKIGNSSARGGAWGSAATPWGPGTYPDIDYLAGSYGMNGWLYDLGASGAVGAVPTPIYYSGIQYYSGVDTRGFFLDTPHHPPADPQRVPVLGDCNWHEAWPLNCRINGVAILDYPPTNLSEGARYDTCIGSRGPNWGQMGRFCIARHGDAVNMVFMDEHAETVPLEKLWTLRWSAFSGTFAPPVPLSGNQ
jgi:type II secretory pathway pseudopilin PulG